MFKRVIPLAKRLIHKRTDSCIFINLKGIICDKNNLKYLSITNLNLKQLIYYKNNLNDLSITNLKSKRPDMIFHINIFRIFKKKKSTSLECSSRNLYLCTSIKRILYFCVVFSYNFVLYLNISIIIFIILSFFF